MEPVTEPEAAWKPVVGPGVSIAPLPSYVGSLGYVQSRARVARTLRRAVAPTDAVILRIPGHVATSLESVLRRRRQPFGAEIVGDVAAAFAPGAIDHVLRPLLHVINVRTVRRQCRKACAIAYVTKHSLQRAYPPSPDAFATHYSSIELPDQAIAGRARVYRGGAIHVVSVGSMAMKYKRFDVLIEATRCCIEAGADIYLSLIGDGRQRSYFEAVAQGLGERVEFLGELPGSGAVRERLLEADVFVLSSANEGLPRVVIEAMAVGLPCIATTVGGTPELLPPEDLVAPGDIAGLADLMLAVVTNPERMQRMSARNLETAGEYVSSKLGQRREAMYRYLRDYTERHICK